MLKFKSLKKKEGDNFPKLVGNFSHGRCWIQCRWLTLPLALLLHGVHHQGTVGYTELIWVTRPEGTGKNPEIKAGAARRCERR